MEPGTATASTAACATSRTLWWRWASGPAGDRAWRWR